MGKTLNGTTEYIEGIFKKFYKGCPTSSGWFGGFVKLDSGRMIHLVGTNRLITEGVRIEGTVHKRWNDYYHGMEYVIERGDTLVISYPSEESMVRYFSSPVFPGIGEKKARRLWNAYGEKTMKAIQNDPDQVRETCNLSAKDMKTLIAGISENSLRLQLGQSFPHIPSKVLDKILEDHLFGKTYKAIVDELSYNPYRLMEKDLSTFSVADQVALNDVHLQPDALIRRSKIFSQAMKRMQDMLNSVCICHFNDPKDNVRFTAANGEWLNVSQFEAFYRIFCDLYTANRQDIAVPDWNQFNLWIWEDVNSDIGALYRERYPDYITDESQKTTVYYLRKMRVCEGYVLNRVTTMLRMESDSSFKTFSQEMVQHLRNWLKKSDSGLLGQTNGDLMDKSQIKAFYHILKHPLSILTGGPGRGKSRTIANLVHFWESVGLPVLVYAPTGKAVNRLRNNDDANCPMAETIARCLYRQKKREKANQEEKNDVYGSILNCDGDEITMRKDVLVIVDESSMIGLEEGSRFLQLFSRCHIVFCGDDNQLPSIAPGAFFHDLIEGGVPVVELTENHRMEFPKILENADAILEADNEKNKKYRYVEHLGDEFCLEPIQWNTGSFENLKKVLLSHYDKALNQSACSLSDILCITPKNCDVNFLNGVLQNHLNPERQYASRQKDNTGRYKFAVYDDRRGRVVPIKHGKDVISYHIGDRVMNWKNCPDQVCYTYANGKKKSAISGIFNGDMGTLDAVVWTDDNLISYLVVRFDDGRISDIPFDMFRDNFRLSYVLTIHKVQGCEARFVFLVISENSKYDIRNGFLNKKMFYTAVTRAKEQVVIFGNTSAFVEGSGIRYEYKNDILRDRLSYAVLTLQKERGDFSGRWRS